VADSFSSEWRDQVPDGQWYRQEDWWVVRERTTRPFGYVKVEANRVLLRGLNGLMSAFEWRDQVLYVRSIGVEGNVRLEEGFLVGRVRFDFWASMMYPELLKAKIRSEIAAGVADVAGTTGFGSKNVFIIHGHNESARAQLSTLLTSLGLKPIVLAQQSERGMTVIEKFEYHAPLCSFAFALLTPDDLMTGVGGGDPLWRARQNVIFELGWFMAKLGRARVVVLCQGEVEILSDLQGLIYIPFKEHIAEVIPRLSVALRDAGLL
jgi:predicted nucleotide-binding protein